MKKKYIITPPLLILVVVLDIVTKHLAHASIGPGAPLHVLSFLQLVNVRNMGAAFGMGDTLGNGFFISVSLVAIALMVWLFIRGDMPYIGLTLVTAGAIGNLYDRITLGYVRDFIDIHVGALHWPAFNVADSALTIGIALLFIMPFFEQREENRKNNEGANKEHTAQG